MSTKAEKYRQWYRVFKRLNGRVKTGELRAEILGRLLLRLVKLGVLTKDAPLADDFEGVPFGIFGTFSLQRLDLGSLIRAWRLGGLRDGCPQCRLESTVLIFSISGSPLSGKGGWTGLCEKCGRLHSYPTTIDACRWCKGTHTSSLWSSQTYQTTGRSSLGRLLAELQRCGKLIGRSVWVRSPVESIRYLRKGAPGIRWVDGLGGRNV